MTSTELRAKFLEFFKKNGHVVVPSSSLVPENDPSVLFTTAGMQQFKTYYTGDRNALKDFGSKNTTTVQKCVRTSDIDEVGDATHLTFFEMLGNFSFGGYGRKEAITYAHDFITKELNLPISYVTFFKGNANVPRDDESKMIWEKLGVKDVREEGSDVFWGPTGESGPCGPTTEIYCKNAEGIDVEIWNIVFNEYFCDGTREMLDNGEARFEKLPTLGIDTGMGFERLLATVQNKKNVFETDVFDNEHTRESRIVADHVKAALFMISDGVIPSNTGQGYVLRRLIRRAVRFSKQPLTSEIEKIKKIYQGVYVLDDKGEIEKEEGQFRETLSRGMKEFEKGIDAFTLFSSYGFPLELTLELAKEKGIEIDVKDFANKFKEHQDLSRAGAEKKFKGGLGDTSEISVRYHTATHLLHQALHDVLKTEITQKGSNITPERLRFDFTFARKMTDEEKKKVEDIINEKIKAALPVNKVVMKKEQAEKTGAYHAFGDKYGDDVSIYYVGDSLDKAYSKEFCGGPHVKNTSELGHFKIQKEEAVSAGVRRIKAVLI